MNRRTVWVGLAVLALGRTPSGGQDVVFEGGDFASWSHPVGLVNVTGDGVEVKRFGTSFDAVANASEHSSTTFAEYGALSVRAPSRQSQADRVADQDSGTWWQPDPEDPVQKWWLELDLRRAVVASKLRVVFPDTLGARPFNFFSVYVSPGISVFGGLTERIVYRRLGRPINNNTSQVVEFDLQSTNLLTADGDNMVGGSTLGFDVVRFVRFEAAGITTDAALAEIEVDGIGFNLSSKVGTESRLEKGETHWGGRTWTSKDRECEGCGKGSGADALLDEDVGFRAWNIESSDKGDWRKSGVWSVVDFGSVFRVDRIIWLPIVGGRSPFLYGFARDKQGGWANFDFLISDGTPDNNADPEVEGPFQYDLLSEVVNHSRYLFDFQFPPRETRLVMWRVTKPSQFQRAMQLFVYHSEGYPARVELESADVSLGGARSIRTVEWDADVPPGSRIEVATQTGNGFETKIRYFLKNGREVTKAAYDAAKSRNRGDIVEEKVRDASWSSWSEPHRFSGQEFLSPSPRQWLRTRIRLISEDPEAMPVLRSLRFRANAPVVAAGLTGQVYPREATLDSLQAFRYTITPTASTAGDAGFDRVVIVLPSGGTGAEFVGARVRGRAVDATGELRGDSLVVQLPPPAVRRDSVEISFLTRLYRSPSVFSTSVLNSAREEDYQGVVPAEFGADQVFVPEAVAGSSVVRGVEHTGVFTPNGDGVNDEYQLSFAVVKTQSQPRVDIFTLGGQHMATLTDQTAGASRPRYVWDGSSAGQSVPPGLYIVRIEVRTDARDEAVQKVLHVAY